MLRINRRVIRVLKLYIISVDKLYNSTPEGFGAHELAKNVYEIITERILEKLEQGTIPWQRPWSGGSCPKNLVSGKEYRGVNVWLLGSQEFSSQFWVSFRQAQDLGGTVRKGERSTPCIFWKFLTRDTENSKTGETETKQIPLVRYYSVFNVEQCDGISHSRLEVETKEPGPFNPIAAAEAIMSSFPDAPSISHDGASAFYRPATDTICMPERQSFKSESAYYATLFHEMTHSTGHESRLARPGVSNPIRYGSHEYSQEELVAEMGSSFLLAEARIDSESLTNNSAAYVASWLKALKNDPKLVVLAAAQAQKAIDHILSREFEGTLEAKAAQLSRGRKHVEGTNQHFTNASGDGVARRRAREHGLEQKRNDRGAFEILGEGQATYRASSRCAGRERPT
jgi:antirestriction protein ArdC